jgi:hypothetical protein
MSCLSVTITNLSPPLNLGVWRLGGIKASVSRYDIPLSFEVSDVFRNNHLKLSCGIVCSVGDVHYLRVLPHELQWITPDEAIIYMVESDTNWAIITS